MKKLLFFFAALFFVASCKDFSRVGSPQDEEETEEIKPVPDKPVLKVETPVTFRIDRIQSKAVFTDSIGRLFSVPVDGKTAERIKGLQPQDISITYRDHEPIKVEILQDDEGPAEVIWQY